ncbi:hypothetical protein RSAG8_07600, partial [Rhizoctonia solani AG-8 WAC10335]
MILSLQLAGLYFPMNSREQETK